MAGPISVDGIFVDDVAESGRNSASKYQIMSKLARDEMAEHVSRCEIFRREL